MVSTTGVMKKGKLRLHKRPEFLAAIRRMRDGPVAVTVHRLRATRTHRQNRWYFGCLVKALAEHTGHGPSEMHEILVAKFFPRDVCIKTGNGTIVGDLVIGATTTKLNRVEFSEYCSEVRRFALEMDLVIPLPEDYDGGKEGT